MRDILNESIRINCFKCVLVWLKRPDRFCGMLTNSRRWVALPEARFGNENQAERFRAELRSRKRNKGESLQKLYQDVCRLMLLACPGESSALSDIVGCDAFLEALDEQALRVCILEKEPRNVDDALNLASWLEAFDIMGSMGPEADKSRSRFVRSAIGEGKEFPFSGEL